MAQRYSSQNAVRVEGLGKLLRVTDAAGREVKYRTRNTLRRAAAPVKEEGAARITPYDSRTAAGYRIVVRRAGTISVEQSLRKSQDTRRRRPKFGALQMRRGLIPAAENNAARVRALMIEALDGLFSNWRN